MDSDVIEEISNFERLVNGNVDFSFNTILITTSTYHLAL